VSLTAIVTGPTAYWYLARATGVVALLLLTASVVLGVLDSQRYTAARWPRFAIDRVHRDVSLLVLVILVVHILTSVLDGFAPITLIDGVVPFTSAYRPLWLGLGALSFDILLAVAITSLLRRRLGYRSWRAVHWLAYASWPVAVFHDLGTGSDIKQGWMLAITVACVAVVVAAAVVRVLRARAPLSALWLGTAALTPVALAVFAAVGPLAPHWARRAGTPSAVLAKAHGGTTMVTQVAPPATPAADRISLPFTARLDGTVTQTPASGGALVDLVLRCRGGIRGEMRVRMAGAPIPGGGLSMTGSQVELTAVGLTSAMQGRILSLQGTQFVARVTDAAGTTLELRASLNIDSANDTVTGTLVGAGA